MSDPSARGFLRHTLATLAYRGGKAIRGAPEAFSEFRAAPGSRGAGEILAHVGDLMDWGLALCDGRHQWRDSPALPWPEACARFFGCVKALDERLASPEPLRSPAEGMFQGPSPTP